MSNSPHASVPLPPNHDPSDQEVAQITSRFSRPEQPEDLGKLKHYRIIKRLGAGGMGVVFQAWDTMLQRDVAVKVISADSANDPVAQARFLREAKSAAGVRHENVVVIYEVGEENGLLFLVMERLKGKSLEEQLAGGPLPPMVAVRIGREIAQALAAAHKSKLVHRDLKPGNVFLEAPKGKVKLLDFGLATRPSAPVNITTTGVVIGTPLYMSPEQCRGIELDGRSDLFSLGVVLYRAVTGKLPFHGTDMTSVAMSIALDEPTAVRSIVPDVPVELADLIHELLAKDRERRPASAEVVAERLVSGKWAAARDNKLSVTSPWYTDSAESSLPVRPAPSPSPTTARSSNSGTVAAPPSAPVAVPPPIVAPAPVQVPPSYTGPAPPPVNRNTNKITIINNARDDRDDDRYDYPPPPPQSSDPAGTISLILGIITVISLPFDCFTCGIGYWITAGLAIIGIILGIFGRGGMRIVGILLNTLALIPAILILLFMSWFIANIPGLPVAPSAAYQTKARITAPAGPTAQMEVWVYVDGVRIVQWPTGQPTVDVPVRPGSHRIVVKHLRPTENTVFDQVVNVPAGQTVPLQLTPAKGN